LNKKGGGKEEAQGLRQPLSGGGKREKGKKKKKEKKIHNRSRLNFRPVKGKGKRKKSASTVKSKGEEGSQPSPAAGEKIPTPPFPSFFAIRERGKAGLPSFGEEEEKNLPRHTQREKKEEQKGLRQLRGKEKEEDFRVLPKKEKKENPPVRPASR